nr:probable flavin-containing monooxygenase 1 [Malus domestica]
MAAANTHHLHSVSKVGIIGAGISGIAAAKQLSGHSPVVFEATNSIGGVWRHCSYNSTKLQTPRCDFEFSNYPWAERDNSSFPSHVEVLEYLHGYATHFDLLKYVKFESKVVEVRYVGGIGHQTTTQFPGNSNSGEYGNLLNGDPVWEVAVQMCSNPNTIQWYAFEFIVVCIGKYGDIPRMPNFPRNKGQEVFQGKVLHSMDYSKLDQQAARELLKGKKVAVIGYKKSAIDMAVECAEANQDRQRDGSDEEHFTRGTAFQLSVSTTATTFVKRWDGNLGGKVTGFQKLLAPITAETTKKLTIEPKHVLLRYKKKE